MTGKTDNEAADALRGLSGEAARWLRAEATKVLAEAVDATSVEKQVRKINAIARTEVAILAAAEAELKADDNSRDRAARRAAVEARTNYDTDEGDETEMNEQPARDPAEVSAALERHFRRVAGWFEDKSGDRGDDAGSTDGGRTAMDIPGPPGAVTPRAA